MHSIQKVYKVLFWKLRSLNTFKTNESSRKNQKLKKKDMITAAHIIFNINSCVAGTKMKI